MEVVCEPRIEFIVKMQKKFQGGGGGGFGGEKKVWDGGFMQGSRYRMQIAPNAQKK